MLFTGYVVNGVLVAITSIPHFHTQLDENVQGGSEADLNATVAMMECSAEHATVVLDYLPLLPSPTSQGPLLSLRGGGRPLLWHLVH